MSEHDSSMPPSRLPPSRLPPSRLPAEGESSSDSAAGASSVPAAERPARDPLASGLEPERRPARDPLASGLEPEQRPARDPLASGLEPEPPPSPKRWPRVLRWCLFAALGLGLAGIATVLVVVWRYSQGLPSVEELRSGYAPPQVTRILARDGTLLANLFTERRTVVPFERVPNHVKQAFLAAEDARFYQHEGLNYLGMLRALWVNLRAGKVSQGGSTITQQVVKNVLLDSERSYERKIRETLLAHRLEQHFSKDEILGLYLNHIYLGHGRWGVEEAAVYYFGKHVEELELAEGALLAGIVASPERFTPRRNEEKALERRRFVLNQMRDKGFITEAVYQAVVDRPLRLALEVEAESDLAPEIVPHVKKLLQQLAGEDARLGGFTVHTTIDPQLQAAARRALRGNLDNYLKRQKLAPPFTLEKRRLWGEVFTGTPRRHGIYTGRVTALDDERHTVEVQIGTVLGRVDLRREERYNPQHLPPSQFVSVGAALRVRLLEEPAKPEGQKRAEAEPVPLRLELGPQGALVAIDVRTREVVAAVGSYEALMGGLDRTVQARRQPGSSFKPFVYSYALHARRVTPATRFTFERSEKPRGADAAEEPESTVEVLSLRQAVAKSDNRVAEQVLAEVGAANVVDWAHSLGIESKLGPTPSLALGAYEVTPLEIANGFATFSAGGQVAHPRFVTRVIGTNGDIPLPAPPPARRVVAPDVAYLMTSLLESVVQEGTAVRAKSLGFPVAGKTGTTNQAKDAWFVGYSTEYAVASWVGYDDALPLGWGESGAVTALPAWIEWMKAAHQGKPATEFPRPPGVIEQRIDPETGLLARYDQDDAPMELFLDGTAPVDVAPLDDSSDDEVSDDDATENGVTGDEPGEKTPTPVVPAVDTEQPREKPALPEPEELAPRDEPPPF